MPFFPDTASGPPRVRQCDTDAARRLRALVVKKADRVRPYRLSKWADEFRLLREEIERAGGDAARIDTALSWYETNYEKDGVPKLLSAAAFRKHFDWIERLARKDAPSTASAAATAAARVVYDRLKGRAWGAGTGNLLPSLVRSAAAVEDVIGRLAPFKTDPRVGGLVRRLYQLVASDAFLLSWYEDVWARVYKWAAWTGTFRPFEVSITSSSFHARMTAEAGVYGDPSLWQVVCALARFPSPQDGK